MGLEARIWASRLEYELQRGVDGEEGGGGEGGKEISPMCKSIGHRPLRGRCPKKEREVRKQERKEKRKVESVRLVGSNESSWAQGITPNPTSHKILFFRIVPPSFFVSSSIRPRVISFCLLLPLSVFVSSSVC